MSGVQELLKNAYKNYKENEYITYKKDKEKVSKTFGKTICDILALSESLIKEELLDKNFLIVGKNSYEWLVSWTAIIGYVGVVIPIDNAWTPSNIKNILNKIDISCIMYSKDYVGISKIKEEHKNIKYICLEDDIPGKIKEGENILNKKEDKFAFEKIDDNKACELIVESAITEDVNFITHTTKNLLSNFEYFNKRLPLESKDKIYLHLQMSSSYINLYSYLYSFYTGTKIYIGNSENMYEELITEKPTAFFGVPMDYKKILTSYGEEEVNKLKKKIKTSMTLKNVGITVNKKKHFKKFHEFLGGNMKYMICFGNFLDKNIKKIYSDVGFRIQNMYGVSGAASLISFEYYENKDVYSEGTILENTSVKIYDPNFMRYGEIIVKGDSVTRCYYNDIEKTQEAFDYKGYFHTGDLGYIEKNNELFLIGSLKKKIVLEDGKIIYPDKLEKMFYDTNKFATVNIYEKNGFMNLSVVTNIDKQDVKNIVDEINTNLPDYMQIKEYQVKKNRLSTGG